MAKDYNKAYHRLDAETRLRSQCVDFAIRCMRILPHTYKDVTGLATRIHAFVKNELKDEIDLLTPDVEEGLRNKYGGIDPFQDLT